MIFSLANISNNSFYRAEKNESLCYEFSLTQDNLKLWHTTVHFSFRKRNLFDKIQQVFQKLEMKLWSTHYCKPKVFLKLHHSSNDKLRE